MYTRQKLKTASDVGKRARGGTRTAFQPLQTLGTRGNIRIPTRSDTCTTQSDAKSVHIVHTPKFDVLRSSKQEPRPLLRERGSSLRWQHCDNIRSRSG